MVQKDRYKLVVLGEDNFSSVFLQDVHEGLSSDPKTLPFIYFYDHIGSRLFEEICELPEYYLTRSEAEILTRYAPQIVADMPAGSTLVELGSGSSTKTRILVKSFLKRDGQLHYVPIDISESMLEKTSRSLIKEYPGLQVTAYAAEYNNGLNRVSRSIEGNRLILFLGSSMGNLSRSHQARFLRELRTGLRAGDRFLLGADLQKDRSLLEAAYADPQGITARFNLNLLERINRDLEGQFDVLRFEHLAFYNPALNRVEMHLRSLERQSVWIEAAGQSYEFRAEETIHTESCHKYSAAQIQDLCEESGFRVARRWTDAKNLFSLNLLAPTGDLMSASFLNDEV